MKFTQKTGTVLSSEIAPNHFPLGNILIMRRTASDPFNSTELSWAQFKTDEKGFRAPVPEAGFFVPGQIVSVFFADGEAFGFKNHDTDEDIFFVIPTGADKSFFKSALIVFALLVGGAVIGDMLGGGEGVIGGLFIGFLSVIPLQSIKRKKTKKLLSAGMQDLMGDAEKAWRYLKDKVSLPDTAPAAE